MRKIFFIVFTISFLFSISTNKIYNIEGMMCGVGCANKISSILKVLDGVEEFSIDFENTTVEVLFDDVNLTSEKVIHSLPSPYKMTLIKETVSKEYAVSGITCMGCVHNINNSLVETKGLENYNLIFEDNLLLIEYDISKTNDQEILDRIPEKFKLTEIVFNDESQVDKEETESDKEEK